MNVAELMMAIEDAFEEDPEMEVRLAIQPNWPFEHSVESTAVVMMGEPGEEATKVLYLAEGKQLGYLPGVARTELGWQE